VKSDKRPIIIVKKKGHGHGGHHGGAWKVAYADFVTAMMAFFMVMWILGMDPNVKDSIEGYFAIRRARCKPRRYDSSRGRKKSARSREPASGSSQN
jgi:flagellar motor protein MotB